MTATFNYRRACGCLVAPHLIYQQRYTQHYITGVALINLAIAIYYCKL